MVVKYRRHAPISLVLAIAFWLCCLPAAQAQETDPEDAVVGQTLSWDGNSQALRYELIINDAANQEVFHQSMETTTVNLQLKPGNYRYKVLVYNLLDQVEADTSWQDMVVLRAELPRATKILPDAQYLENPVFHFLVEGAFLKDGAQYRLYRQDKPEIRAMGKVVSHRNDNEVDLEFPDFEFSFGDYNLTIVNPGGLKYTLKNALKVRYEKPIDFHFDIGYAPVIIMYDDWYANIWNKGFYPLGADVRLAMMFVKRDVYQVGAELEVGGWLQSGGIPEATINSQYLSFGLNLVYSYLFSKQFRLMVRAGGGVVSGWHAFDYAGTSGVSWNSVDPFASLNVGANLNLTKWWYLEADVGWIHGFNVAYSSGWLRPMICTGLTF